MIFESHAHYDDEAFDEDRKELLDALPAQGIGRVINVCAEVEGWGEKSFPYGWWNRCSSDPGTCKADEM